MGHQMCLKDGKDTKCDCQACLNLAGPSLSLDGILLQVGRIVKVPSKMTFFFVWLFIKETNQSISISTFHDLSRSQSFFWRKFKGQLGVYTPNSVPMVFNLLCFSRLLGIITHKYSCKYRAYVGVSHMGFPSNSPCEELEALPRKGKGDETSEADRGFSWKNLGRSRARSREHLRISL